MATNLTQEVIGLYSTRPNTAILMSGSGSNALAILHRPEIRDLYNIDTLVTDNGQSNARDIAENYGLELIENHVDRFSDQKNRTGYFDELAGLLAKRGIQAAFYAGFMKISTPEFCERFPGVNVHPADLSIIGGDGIAKYRGMKAMSQMRGDLGYVRSTAHVVDNPVDSGSAIALSGIVYPEAGQSDVELHERLKLKEHYLYPETLKLLGKGLVDLSRIPLLIIESGDSSDE